MRAALMARRVRRRATGHWIRTHVSWALVLLSLTVLPAVALAFEATPGEALAVALLATCFVVGLGLGPALPPRPAVVSLRRRGRLAG